DRIRRDGAHRRAAAAAARRTRRRRDAAARRRRRVHASAVDARQRGADERLLLAPACRLPHAREGIAPLWPFSKRRIHLNVIHRTGDRRETAVVLLTALVTAVLAWSVG